MLGAEDWVVGRADVEAVCAVGNPRARRSLVRSLEEQGVRFATVLHPSVLTSEYVELGAGCIVGAGAVLTTQVRLGDHVVIGTGAVVSHDCVLDDFATLAPGVLLAGRVRVECGAELGVGATVIPERCVGRGALVAAHAAVVSDVPPNSVVAGVPARSIRDFPTEEQL